MKARKLIEGSVCPPEALKVLDKAFEDAWAEIAHKYKGDAHVIEQARLQLAHAVLAVSSGDSADPDEVKTAALRAINAQL